MNESALAPICIGVMLRILALQPESDEQYAPPVIYSREDRAKLTWLIEATPEGAAAGLTPGQPVTVFPAAAGRP